VRAKQLKLKSELRKFGFPLAARDVTAGDFLYLQRQAASLLAMIFRIVRHRKLLKSCDALKFASFDLALCVCV